jgi:2-polyprenyl-6-hydroxyphenyl methylase/3-demethylubiquinone-9 3-methyltransferase
MSGNAKKQVSYYVKSLSSNRLQSVYETAPSRIKQYLNAEIEFVLSKIKPGDKILELGCGYGRVLKALADKAGLVVGIDISMDTLLFAVRKTRVSKFLSLSAMDAACLGIKNQSFDAVICVQNGISALHLDPKILVAESFRILSSGGRLLFSSYSENFWEERLNWFRFQADMGLIGKIDENRSRDGKIICEDGFTATTFSSEDFFNLFSEFNKIPKLTEVDRSSLFCEVWR